MERTTRDTGIALLGGGGISTGLQWLAGHHTLAFVTGLCWTCALKLTLHIGHLYPAYATGETWADKRWTGLGTGLITLAALLGVSPQLPITNELRLGLGFLVLGTGLGAYTAGTLAVLERVEADSSSPPADPKAQQTVDNE